VKTLGSYLKDYYDQQCSITLHFKKREKHMKKHLLALAALATVSGAAFAQSNATIYGILDTSIHRINHATSATGPSATQMSTATWLPSVLGFTGTEDLGGGLKAKFQLEADINTQSGSYNGNLFRRISTVGLSSNQFGSITLGRQINQLFLQSFLNNVRLAHSGSMAIMGGLKYSPSATDGSNPNANTDTGIFQSNTVAYTSPTYNGLNVTLTKQIGGAAGSSSKSSAYSYGANYVNGPLALVAVHEEHKDALGVAQNRNTLLGAKYTVGATQFNIGHTTYKDPSGTAAVDTKALEFGVGYSITPAVVAAFNYVTFDDNVAGVKPTSTSLSLKYALSKRTSAWVLHNQTDGKGSVSLNNLYGVAIAQGASYTNTGKATGTAVGLTHTF
jgi:predicted porin